MRRALLVVAALLAPAMTSLGCKAKPTVGKPASQQGLRAPVPTGFDEEKITDQDCRSCVDGAKLTMRSQRESGDSKMGDEDLRFAFLVRSPDYDPNDTSFGDPINECVLVVPDPAYAFDPARPEAKPDRDWYLHAIKIGCYCKCEGQVPGTPKT